MSTPIQIQNYSNSRLRSHNYDYQSVVIGNGLEALLYALYNNYYIIPNVSEPPSFLDFLKPGPSRALGIEENWELQTQDGPKEFGYPIVDLWRRIVMNLSLRGQCYPVDKLYSIRLQDNILKIQTKDSRLTQIHFENLYIFNECNINGLPIPEREDDFLVKVVDWMDVRSGMSHAYDYYESGDDFINKIFFYPSDRIDGDNFRHKDVCAISFLDRDRIKEFEYSDTYARFKIEKIMKTMGIKGARNGRSVEDPTKYKYYALKVESREREIFRCERDTYKNFDSVHFMHLTVEDIIEQRRESGGEVSLFSGDSSGCRPKIRF